MNEKGIKTSITARAFKLLLFSLLLMVIISGCADYPGIDDMLQLEKSNSIQIESSSPVVASTVEEKNIEPSSTATTKNTPTKTATNTLTPTATDVPCDWAELVDYGYQNVSSNSGNIIPGSEFIYTWRLKNSGLCIWTSDYEMGLVEQNGLSLDQNIPFPIVTIPGQIISISTKITAPDEPGDYSATWRVKNANGEYFDYSSPADIELSVEFSVAPPVVYIKEKPTTSLPQEVIEICGLSSTEEKKINQFLEQNAIFPTMSEESDDGILNDPGTKLAGQVKIFRVSDSSSNGAAPIYKLKNTSRKTYVSIDSKSLIPNGTEVVFVNIPMNPPLKLLQKELQRLIPGYDGPTLTNEFPTTLGYYVHVFPIYGRDRCKSVVGAIFHDNDTEIYVDYRFPDQE